ncbi:MULTISPECIES: inositol monophosphatase family protein [unclassified Neptuniibacter]|uniref:inositol monophosphatase family protein n=1 Tax=unclassified Neptuniibacter TaxID=2630693 RepID=UPI000C421FA8|nr:MULTISPECIES: inositol monophosphatase family protein [unclassified Neptuniibacter]MAY40712.1 inositol monophosphatase [Oceanospirillaceae bacterium]|tara:strand:+ start:15750 stop:16562 length:813 start_codon:yes stop_codon:yes gene_type:complete
MQPMVNIALRAARVAGEQITRAVERLDLIKSEQADVAKLISDTCKKAELSIVQAIHKAYPSHKVVGEYTGEHAPIGEGPEFSWNINPIDSISNFSSGLPAFAFCLAGQQNNRLEHALILNPITGEEFTASRGHGAQLNGKRLRVSNQKSVEGALIGTGFFNRSSDKDHLDTYLEIFRDITTTGGTIYNGGSPALNLAYIAAGRIDGYYQIGLNFWEIEAGLLLVQEAGGLAGDFKGSNEFRKNGNLIVGNPKMFKALIKALQTSLPSELK